MQAIRVGHSLNCYQELINHTNQMESIVENGEEYILISKQSHLDEILTRVSEQRPFADRFKFTDKELFVKLLKSLEINFEDFTEKYFYYDSSRKIHVSESGLGYVWISTSGLVANRKVTKNRAVNSCLNQYLVISLLFEKAIEVVEDERVYDVDSYSSGLLSKLSPAIFHNLTFYIEVFCKAYLSLTGNSFRHNHNLSLLYHKTVDTMSLKGHGDSLFQILVLDPLYKFIDHVRNIPGNFKEHFIKYDDNPSDDSVILFEPTALFEMTIILELSVDFISDYFYEGEKTHYLESDIYRKMLDRADTEEKKRKIREMYPHLAKDS